MIVNPAQRTDEDRAPTRGQSVLPSEHPFKSPPQIALVTNGGQGAPRDGPARGSPRREGPEVPPPGGPVEDERQTSASGQPDGQSLSAAPQVAREEGMALEPDDARRRDEAGARALVATAVSREGRPGPFPYMERTPMSNFYDAVQMARQAMRGENLDSVLLPHAAMNNGTMPIHLETFAEQLPVQFQFRDIDLQRDDITLHTYGLRAQVVIPAGPRGQLRAY